MLTTHKHPVGLLNNGSRPQLSGLPGSDASPAIARAKPFSCVVVWIAFVSFNTVLYTAGSATVFSCYTMLRLDTSPVVAS